MLYFANYGCYTKIVQKFATATKFRIDRFFVFRDALIWRSTVIQIRQKWPKNAKMVKY